MTTLKLQKRRTGFFILAADITPELKKFCDKNRVTLKVDGALVPAHRFFKATYDAEQRQAGASLGETTEKNTVHYLKKRNAQLERDLRLLRDENIADRAIEDLTQQIAAHMGPLARKGPMKYRPAKAPKGKDLGGIPTLLLSDLHWGEVVDPQQVQGYNEYNLEIAQKRLQRVFTKTDELLSRHFAGLYWDGIVVGLGGDMLSGNIHEELRQTNDAPVLDCVMSLAENLRGGLSMLAERYPQVFVPAVVGNHGRIDRKPTAKYKVKDNFDYLLYRIVRETMMRTHANIDFEIAESADLRYDIYGTRYLLTHGDQFKGGAGVGGIWPSLMRGDFRKRKRSIIAGNDGYDVTVLGHFHQLGHIEGLIVNGSLKGYDEWVYTMNFGFEPAQQALWITHPKNGVTNFMGIYGDAATSDDSALSEPIRISRRTEPRVRGR